MKKIELANGGYTLVSDKDYPFLSRFVWVKDVRGRIRMQFTSMSRFLMKAPKGMMVDHINGDVSDNRRENLRICTGSQNNGNVKKFKKDAVSKYKGVTKEFHHGGWRWRARICDKYKVLGRDGYKISLGSFKSEESAAEAYNRAARIVFGEFAVLNDIRPTNFAQAQ